MYVKGMIAEEKEVHQCSSRKLEDYWKHTKSL